MQYNKRKVRLAKAQALAREKGHCLCSIEFTCPCNWFKKNAECACCGDQIDNKKWRAFNHKKTNENKTRLNGGSDHSQKKER